MSFCLSACLVLIVVLLLYVRPSFPFVSWCLGRKVIGIVLIPDHCLPVYLPVIDSLPVNG